MIQRSKYSRTSATILPIRSNGERPALHSRGASDDLLISEVHFEDLCSARFLQLGGTGLMTAMDKGPSAALLAYVKSRGLTVSFDLIAPNEKTMDFLADLLPCVDYFMPSMEQAAFLCGKDDPATIAEIFLSMGAKTCIFKWGERGSYVHTTDSQFRIPAFKVHVSDLTGCGDSYCGGFIAGLAMGRDLRGACELGTATSGLVATGLCSDAGVVNLAQVEAFASKTERLP